MAGSRQHTDQRHYKLLWYLTFERDKDEFATSIHTEITIAVGRIMNPSVSGKKSIASHEAETTSEITPAAVNIFHE